MPNQGFIFIFIIALLISACSSNNDKKSNTKKLSSEITAKEGENQASGYVFHDKNSNKKRDKNEPGIPDVAVSNGQDVAVTDSKGHYALPVTNGASVFVIKPKNWMTPVNNNKLPDFYYHHKPKGSPSNLRYRGIAPTNQLPEEINFPMYKTHSGKKFKIVVFGDPQPYNIKEIDYLSEDIISELLHHKDLKFGMTMGDIVGDSLPLFRPLNRAVAKIGIPWYNVMGNHDVNYQAPNDVLSDETFERVYGPTTYAFEYGDVHFIVLDDIIHKNKAGSREYVGGLRPVQLEFVKNYLKTVPKENLIVLNMHIPFSYHDNRFRNSDQEKLFALLKEFPHTLSISAHTHIQENKFFHKDTTAWQRTEPHHHYNIGTTSGSWWNGMKDETNIPHTMMRDGTPNGYSFITFEGNEYTIDWKVAGSSKNHRMNIHVPRGITAGSGRTFRLTVNFFNGSKQTKVEYKIHGQSNWQKMQKVRKKDPFYVKLDQRWKNFKKLELFRKWNNNSELAGEPLPGSELPQADKSSHIWEATLDNNLPRGRHVIEVKVTDRYGRTFTDFQTIRIET